MGRKKAKPSRAPEVKPAPSAPKVAQTSVKRPLGGDVLAGSLARAASQTTIHPLDTVKVRIQSGLSKMNSAQTAAASKAGGKMKLDLKGAVKGFGLLYKGAGGAATGASLAMAAYFASYGAAKKVLGERTDLTPSGIAFWSGAVGAVGSSFVKIPAAVCIRSVQADVYPGVIAAFGSINAEVGWRGLYTGYVPTLLEDVPDMAVKFAVYEALRSLHRRATSRNTQVHEDLAIGGFAGAAAAAVSTPLDVIKTRMMVNAAQRPTMMSAARGVLKDSGAGGFMAGVVPRSVANGINSAIFFCFFEAMRSIQQKQWQLHLERKLHAEVPSRKGKAVDLFFNPSKKRLMFRRGTAVN